MLIQDHVQAKSQSVSVWNIFP